MSGPEVALTEDEIVRVWKSVHQAIKLSHVATELVTPGGQQDLLVIPHFFVCALAKCPGAWSYLRTGPGKIEMDVHRITLSAKSYKSTADATFPRTVSGISGKLRGLSVAEIGREEAYEAGLRWVPPAGAVSDEEHRQWGPLKDMFKRMELETDADWMRNRERQYASVRHFHREVDTSDLFLGTLTD
jgi:hypothetical protein